VPLGDGRPARPGITRTTLRDDSRVTVTRVQFEPGAAEEPHTHPYDIVVIPLETVPVQLVIGGREMSTIEEGSPNFMGKGVTHFIKNTGTKTFAVIAVALKQDDVKK
jgi:quercetin dioxygenase-like cupin family protein